MQNPGNNKKQTFNMFKSLTLVAFVACALVAVRADGDEDFGCDLCTAVITDFTPELKTGVLEGYFDRLCDDFTTDFETYDEECKTMNEASFEVIKALLKSGESAQEVCKALGACGFGDDLKKQLLQRFHSLAGRRFAKDLRMKKLLRKH